MIQTDINLEIENGMIKNLTLKITFSSYKNVLTATANVPDNRYQD